VRRLLRPTLLSETVWDIDLDTLWQRGIRGLILDLDNTIVDWNDTWVRPEVRDWIANARRRGLRMCVASNALKGRRVARVAEALGLSAVVRAGKPFPRAFRRAMTALGTDVSSTCAIGDQVLTDMLGAHWLGLTSVLVRPLSPRESPHTRLIRLLERPLRRRWAAAQAAGKARSRDSAWRGKERA
jgi:HAD superfamily phosphatase (TIGR01668 family)